MPRHPVAALAHFGGERVATPQCVILAFIAGIQLSAGAVGHGSPRRGQRCDPASCVRRSPDFTAECAVRWIPGTSPGMTTLADIATTSGLHGIGKVHYVRGRRGLWQVHAGTPAGRPSEGA